MHRFYCPSLEQTSQTISIISPQEIHHVKDVLRSKPGDDIILFNGRGGEARGIITHLSARQATVIVSSFEMKVENQTRVILACAVPKHSKFELIIEKATELGVDEIVPLQTERTEVRYTEAKRPAKQKRFEAIALAASKQSQRSVLPVVHPVRSFSEALKLIDRHTLALIPWLEGPRVGLFQALVDHPNVSRIVIFIGPEGDFTSLEIDQAVQSGCLPVSLGQTVLRVETAAIAVTSSIRQYCHWKKGMKDAHK